MEKYLLKINGKKGITLISLVVTIIILLILAGVAIYLILGDDGIFKRAQDATDRYKAEEIIEEMQIIKANTAIDNKGKFNKDDFFDNLVEEGIVGDREEIIDNGDGSHTITTDEGYVIDIIEKDEGKDVEIEYVGKGEKVGPRIKEIHVRNKTTSTIEIEVEASNANGAKYTYSYKLESEEEYKEAATKIDKNTYKYESLEANKIYNIKVEVENRGIKKEKVINVRTGELPEGAISIGEVVWENGKAKVEVNINKEIEGNLKLEYKINEEGSWIEIQDGEIIENLEHNQTVYVRLTDGTNETEYLSTKIEDNIKPEVSIELGTITSNSIQVQVTASDKETGLADTNTYEYYLDNVSKGTSNDSTYTFSNLLDGREYTLKVIVTDKAGNTNEAEIKGTTEEITSGLVEGVITFTSPTWSGGMASIKISTNTSYQIEYQRNGTTGTWTKIENGGTISGLSHNNTVYARLTDGINSGEYASTSIKDTTKPEVSISLGTITSNSIQVQVTAQDKETGLIETNAYEYYLDNASKGTSNDSTYTFSNLLDGREYTLKVIVTDKAGNTNEAEIKGTTEEVTSGLVEGAITFTNPTWSGGMASIKVSTNTSYQIEYQKNGTTGTWTKIASGETISGLSHNNTVYARLTDGVNSGEYASTSIKDTTKPTVSIKTGTIKSNSIKVTVTASDGQTGLATSNTYEYFLNGTSKGKSTSNSYTYSNLADGITYTLKVKVLDKAGNSNEASTTGTTSTVPAGTVSGAITFTSPTWSGGKASIKVSTNTSYQIEYQKNSTTGTWTKIASGGTVSGLSHSNTVYARLTDGANAGGYASTSIKDTIAPTVSSISTSNITQTSVKLTVAAVDNQSGLAEEGAYTYYLNNSQKASNNTNSYTYTGLTANTSYTLKVVVKDKAGKTTEKSTTITTTDYPIVSATDITANAIEYYGAEVTGYTCTNSAAVSKWRIFYADSTNIYLIADDYIASQYAPKGQNGNSIYVNSTDYKLSMDNVYKDYTGAEWINTNSKGKKWLSQFLNSYGTSTNTNIRAVAYMMDTNVWSTFAGTKAEYAMGGPTLELFCASYKQTHSSKYVEYNIRNSDGYGVKQNTGSSYSDHTTGLPQDDFNQIYIKSDTSKALGMWLASPSSRSSSNLMYAYYNGQCHGSSYKVGLGFRPIVCLKSDVRLKKTSEGVYAIQ